MLWMLAGELITKELGKEKINAKSSEAINAAGVHFTAARVLGELKNLSPNERRKALAAIVLETVKCAASLESQKTLQSY